MAIKSKIPEEALEFFRAQGSRGGKRGTDARMEKITPEERSAVALKAAAARCKGANRKGRQEVDRRKEMKTALRLAMLSLLALTLATAGKKDRDWQTGKLMAARTVNTGARARSANGIAGAPGQLGVVAKTITALELEIFGDVYAYTVRDLGNGVLKHPCRYIVGDAVKHVQERSVLYLIDADGKDCRTELMTQERIPPDLKPAGPVKD